MSEVNLMMMMIYHSYPEKSNKNDPVHVTFSCVRKQNSYVQALELFIHDVDFLGRVTLEAQWPIASNFSVNDLSVSLSSALWKKRQISSGSRLAS